MHKQILIPLELSMKLFLIFFTNLLLVSAFCQPKIDQAKRLFEDKKFEEAKMLLSHVDSEDKDYSSAQYYLGIIAYKQKMYDDAAEHIE